MYELAAAVQTQEERAKAAAKVRRGGNVAGEWQSSIAKGGQRLKARVGGSYRDPGTTPSSSRGYDDVDDDDDEDDEG